MKNPFKLLSILLIVSGAALAGCTSGREVKPEAKFWHVITIDSCEYIENSRWNDVPLIHKGNCKNPIHYKK